MSAPGDTEPHVQPVQRRKRGQKEKGTDLFNFEVENKSVSFLIEVASSRIIFWEPGFLGYSSVPQSSSGTDHD
jgi:hypothetical protein